MSEAVKHDHRLMVFELGMALKQLRGARRWLAGIEVVEGGDIRADLDAIIRRLEEFPEVVAEADELEED